MEKENSMQFSLVNREGKHLNKTAALLIQE
jgi:hypothetical protein